MHRGGYAQILLPFFVFLVLVEYAAIRLRGRGSWNWTETLSTVAIALGNRASVFVSGLLVSGLYEALWPFRLATLSLQSPWAIGALFLAVEFCYYWEHRVSHRVRWLWATHAVHHSVTAFNLSAAARLGWTAWLSGNGLFFAPLVILGFAPQAILAMLALNLAYQFLLHTEQVGRLGPLEWFLNTPSHHRVHHAANRAYLDRNFGGILIVYDRLFGTHACESAERPCRYGLTVPLQSNNPFRIAFHEWARMLREFRKARGPRECVRCLFGPPVSSDLT